MDAVSEPMTLAGLVFAGIGALIHLYIFYLESVVWTGDRARATFGTSPSEAQTTRKMAFNQGFYNLFLAMAVVLGVIFVLFGNSVVGLTLIWTGTGSMVAAGLVLLISAPTKARAALIQLLPPLLGAVLLAVA